MREYILTPKEKQIIKTYLETGKQSEGYRMILSRCRHIKLINEDLQLIEQFLKKTGEKA